MVKKDQYVWTGRTYYASKAWQRDIVLLAKRNLKNVDFDTFVCTGLSGIVIAAKLSHLMDKKLLIVRKDRATTHSSNGIEGELGLRWIFIDDFVSSGRTKANCIEGVSRQKHIQGPIESVGIGEYLYGQYADTVGFTPWDKVVK